MSSPRQTQVEALRAVTIFRGVPDEELEGLVAKLRRRTFKRNEVIMHQGDPAGAIHIIREGQVKVMLDSESGDETVLALLGAGECFGEMAALDGGPRSASVVTVEPTETLMLQREDLLYEVTHRPDFALAIISTLAARLRRVNEWLEDAYFLDLETRMARRLLEMAEERGVPTKEGIEVEMPLTQAELAGMLGATRVSVNRMLAMYQDAGLLRLGRKSFTVLKPAALRRQAGR